MFTKRSLLDKIELAITLSNNYMKISQKRQLDRFKRCLDFMQKHAKDFSPESEAIKTTDQLKDVMVRAESDIPENDQTKGGRRVYRSDKLTALNALRAELGRISRTASLVASKDNTFDNTFKMPDKRRKDELAAAARHFIEEFPKVSDKFEGFEMNADSLDKLKSALEAYEQVQATPSAKPERQPRTPTSPNPIIAQGIELVDALDVMIGNKYNEKTEVFAAWKEASALEVTRRQRKTKKADA